MSVNISWKLSQLVFTRSSLNHHLTQFNLSKQTTLFINSSCSYFQFWIFLKPFLEAGSLYKIKGLGKYHIKNMCRVQTKIIPCNKVWGCIPGTNILRNCGTALGFFCKLSYYIFKGINVMNSFNSPFLYNIRSILTF